MSVFSEQKQVHCSFRLALKYFPLHFPLFILFTQFSFKLFLFSLVNAGSGFSSSSSFSLPILFLNQLTVDTQFIDIAEMQVANMRANECIAY